MAGIQGYAIHLPRLTIDAQEYQRQWGRCAARIEAKRVPDHDEDEFTLALAAARALQELRIPEPSFVAVASATAGSLGGTFADAVGLGAARVEEFRGALAGLQALQAANDAVAVGNAAALVVSADAPRFAADDEREHGAGAAASAWLLAPKGPVQLRRAAHGTSLEQALANLTRSGLAADSVARAAGQELDARFASAVAKALPKARLAAAGAKVGDVGATSPLLGLAQAIEEAQPGEALVLAAAGAGSASALSLEVERAPQAVTLAHAQMLPAEALDYPRMARLRGWLSEPRSDVSQGAAVSLAQYAESLPARLRFEAQRCASCGSVQFPPRATCLQCRGARFEAQRLHGLGTVHSVSTIGRGSAPAEFAEQQRRAGAYDVAIVQLQEGPRVAAQVCDAAPGALRIGDAVALVVRRLYVQDGAPRYGFKARPA